MRMIESRASPFGIKRTMLVENTQNPKYKGSVICYMYEGEADGPPVGYQVFYDATIADVVQYLEEACGVERTEWSQIPDQLPGCLEEWISPVRLYRDQNGEHVSGEFERLENGTWTRFHGK